MHDGLAGASVPALTPSSQPEMKQWPRSGLGWKIFPQKVLNA
jgi:hypothetical protein